MTMIVKRVRCAGFLLACALCLFFTACGVSFAADGGIGMVSALEGRAVARRNGADVALALKDRVFESDAITASAGAKIQILLDDDSAITIAQDSTIQISDFLDSGSDSKFSAHLAEGHARIVTGRITENNPDGFNVTTKHAAIGIRGTILTITATEDGTLVNVENTDKTVLVNGMAVPEFHRAIIREGNEPALAPLSPEERENGVLSPVGRESGAPAPEERENDALFPESGGLAEQAAPDMKNPTPVIPAYAHASGELNTNVVVNSGNSNSAAGPLSGNFGFDLDLQTGAISGANVVMQGGINGGGSNYQLGMNLRDGEGIAGPGGFRVEDFDGTLTVTVDRLTSHTFVNDGSYIAGSSNLLSGGDFIVSDIDFEFVPVPVTSGTPSLDFDRSWGSGTIE
jgi:hypothetical protein